MARKPRIPLDMGNDIMVRTIDELKEHYNAEKVTEYFLNGKLFTWLKDRYYDEEAEQVEKLSEQTNLHNPAAKLGEIFGIEIKESVNVEELETRREKLEKLRAITSDDEILDNVDSVAFSQEDLGDLLDVAKKNEEKKKIIYLCGDKFRIPLSVKNIKYIGVNNPAVSIGGKCETNLEESGISFEKCELPEEIKEKIAAPAKSVDSEFKIKVYVPKQTPAVKSNNTVLAADYNGETLYIYFSKNNFEIYNIYTSHKRTGSVQCQDNSGILSIKEAKEYANFFGNPNSKSFIIPNASPNLISKTEVHANGPSAFEIYKMQVREALENLPKRFAKSDGIVDIKDSETIAAIDEAVKLFVAYNNLNPDANIIRYDPDEEPYD